MEYIVTKCDDGKYRVAYEDAYETEEEAVAAMEGMGEEEGMTEEMEEEEPMEEEEVRGEEALKPKYGKKEKGKRKGGVGLKVILA